MWWLIDFFLFLLQLSPDCNKSATYTNFSLCHQYSLVKCKVYNIYLCSKIFFHCIGIFYYSSISIIQAQIFYSGLGCLDKWGYTALKMWRPKLYAILDCVGIGRVTSSLKIAKTTVYYLHVHHLQQQILLYTVKLVLPSHTDQQHRKLDLGKKQWPVPSPNRSVESELIHSAF